MNTEKLQNAPGWDAERLEALAQDIQKWLAEHGMWVDTNIYYDGKVMTTHKAKNGEDTFRYNGEPFIFEADPREYFEYVADPHILSMSFEGPLYELINYDGALLKEFNGILTKHSKTLYYELGNAWNLTCYEAE